MPSKTVEVRNFREMMESIPFDDNEPKKFVPACSTLVLFVSEYNTVQEPKEDDFRIEKDIDDLSREAEENVTWVLKLYGDKFDDLLFVIAKLKKKRWRPVNSEFKKNAIVYIKTLPTLKWFDEPYVLEGAPATDLMSIKEFFDLKLREIERKAKFLPTVEEEKYETVTIEFKSVPKFHMELWDLDVATKAAEEAEKRVRQVEEGWCKYEVMMDVFLRMSPQDRIEFLKNLEEADPAMLPFGSTEEREDKDDTLERSELDLELDKPYVKQEIIAVERKPTPAQVQEMETKAKKPKKKKGKGKKGKGKKGKGKGKKGKGKKGGKKKK